MNGSALHAGDLVGDWYELEGVVIARAMGQFAQGRAMTECTWAKQDAYAATLRTDPAAAALRDFARRTWGPMWTMRTLGF